MDSAAEQRFLAWATARMPRLHRTAYLLCGDWHLAEDAVQESLARTANHWLRVESGNPDAYVRKVLVNQLKQRWRRPSVRHEQVSDILAESEIDDGSQDRADRDELMVALRKLPSRQRAAVVLRYFEQLSEAETAKALGCSQGTVKSQTHHAVKALKRIMSTEVQPC
jgi:RNA polymerase sigma-70 factor (sigma-E family)